ncbi:MAG: 7-cyano-7-deazaguanine synthase QueC [Bdellovibrionaceae bacterium]|nr:7-cyano-7-deazaguanine synthase QueC [Pseudobdellovibrionaceae bacterium]NUM58443.1 7-cyano-7-deazaguanine synthase QueC [Pseudobdellovibrionaceae bacterium]
MSAKIYQKTDKAVVILSGGLDSSMNLFLAKEELSVVKAITFDYGQRASQREIEAAKRLAGNVHVVHQVIDVKWMKSFGGSSLLDENSEIPTNSVEIDDLNQSFKTAKSVWVPNRNGIFLNIAAGVAEAVGAQFIIPGFNKEEAATFPDNSEEFLLAMDRSLAYSTANQVKTLCFTTDKNKSEIVAIGKQKKFPFEQLWSCYFAGVKWCGVCESCKRLKRALLVNSIDLRTHFLE